MKFKKKIISSIVALSFTAATLPFIYAETANTSEAISELTAPGKEALTLADKSLSGGNLRAKIDFKVGILFYDKLFQRGQALASSLLRTADSFAKA